MRRAAILAALLGGISTGWLGYQFCAGQSDRVTESHFANVMGTSLDIRIRATSDAAAHDAESAIMAEIARASKILSGYDPTSEFSQWMQSSGVPTTVSPELIEVFSAFDQWRARTAGTLDPATEAISAVWRQAARERRVPTAADLQAVVAAVHQRHWIVDPRSSTLTHTSDVPLILNSFTKSYIIDRAAQHALGVHGVSGVLLNAGGDVVVRGPWTQTVGVADPVNNADNAAPLATVAVRDAAVATSGGYKRGFDIAGRHYSHVIDPRTGQPTGHVLSATVVSSNAIAAGALATAFCVLTPSESASLARRLPGVEFALALENGQRIESEGWRDLEVQQPVRPVFRNPIETLYAAEQANAAAPRLTINLELARVSGMARRPYVAIWIEDKDKFPVRTVALWYDGKSRYLPELRAWYRADRLRAMAEGSQIVDTVTSATRTAGSYTLQWDGNDNAGKPVPPGRYAIYIEASREHGTYQIIRQDIDVPGAAKHVDLAGGTEIAPQVATASPNREWGLQL